MMQQAKVMSMRNSGYITHRVPDIKPIVAEPMETDEAIELLEYVITTMSSDESAYHRHSEALEKEPKNLSVAHQKQRALQAMNMLISMKKKEIAQALGLTDREFLSRYLPRKMNQFWFCWSGNEYRTPADFLRVALCLLRKQGAVNPKTM